MTANLPQTMPTTYPSTVSGVSNIIAVPSVDTIISKLPHLHSQVVPASTLSSEKPSPDSSICPTPHTAETLHLTRTSTLPSPYFLLPLWQKWLIVFTLSFTALTATFSSTSLFSVISEISEDLHASSSTISLSNAGVLLFMGCSSFVWGPIGRLIGRIWSWISATAVLLVCTIGTAVAPNQSVFIAMRLLGGLEGTSFHVASQSMLADLFEPVSTGEGSNNTREVDILIGTKGHCYWLLPGWNCVWSSIWLVPNCTDTRHQILIDNRTVHRWHHSRLHNLESHPLAASWYDRTESRLVLVLSARDQGAH